MLSSILIFLVVLFAVGTVFEALDAVCGIIGVALNKLFPKGAIRVIALTGLAIGILLIVGQ